MEITLLIIIGVLLLVNLYFSIVKKNSNTNDIQNQTRHAELKTYIESVLRDTQRLETAMRDEIARNRSEINNALKANREEIANSFTTLGESTNTTLSKLASLQKSQLDTFSEQLQQLTQTTESRLTLVQEQMINGARESRTELANSFKTLGDTINKTLNDIASLQKSQLDTFSEQLQNLTKTNEGKLTLIQEQLSTSARESRAELANSLKNFQESFTANVRDFNDMQKQKFDALQNKQSELNTTTETRLNSIRETVEGRLKSLQDENIKKLDEMRATVDEKLQSTVEKRFNESFKMISERLEQVHKGLGEMQTLASGVGDLKKVLTNVKTRGTLGEIQLGTILEQFLSPEQYICNAVVKPNSLERVEFAIKLPGRSEYDKPVLVPIDSKFPIEDYQRLIDTHDNIINYTTNEVESISKQFENAVKKNAKDIRDKYINPPTTSDFAIMFVPTEGLYAEILRRTGLFETLQRDFKITVVGPSNLVAFLSSLQMGFRTLAIEKRSSEVWEVLSAVKTEFGNFGVILDKTKKKLQEATNVIDKAGIRTRAIERKLRNVQELPASEADRILENTIDFETGNNQTDDDLPDNDDKLLN